jgi:FdrA protein
MSEQGRMKTALDTLLQDGPVVLNLGLWEFAEALQDQGAEVIHIDWQPPAGGDEEVAELLDKLL